MSRKPKQPTTKTIRCAIYTRKSCEEGLDLDFNSLDAQRESGEAYIASQQHEGWTCLPEHYDEGGFSGGSMERPALGRLLADIEAGKINCVVVYKVDRLSRSLLYFARIMEIFEQRQISFVSVTQQFNTATSMGRLTQILNLTLLAPDIQEELLFLPRVTSGKAAIHERMLRPIAAETDWVKQREMWSMVATVSSHSLFSSGAWRVASAPGQKRTSGGIRSNHGQVQR